jgi:hypothetical protein
MTIQAEVSAFGGLLLFQYEIEVNGNRKGRGPSASLERFYIFRD